MYEQNVSYLVKHSELEAKSSIKMRLKIVEKWPLQNYSRMVQELKWPLQYPDFQKFFGETCLRTPSRAFLFSICFKIILPEELRLKYMSNLGTPSLKKFSEYAADMKTFSKGLVTPFLGLTSLHSVNIQPNSKFHPLPTKVFWIHSWS